MLDVYAHFHEINLHAFYEGPIAVTSPAQYVVQDLLSSTPPVCSLWREVTGHAFGCIIQLTVSLCFNWSVRLQPAGARCLTPRQESDRFLGATLLSEVKCSKLMCVRLPEEVEATGERSVRNWFLPLFSWQSLLLFIGIFIKPRMKRKRFLRRGRAKHKYLYMSALRAGARWNCLSKVLNE